jgi:hypothetical protein
MARSLVQLWPIGGVVSLEPMLLDAVCAKNVSRLVRLPCTSGGERSWELKFDTGVDALTGKRLTKYHSFKGSTKREAQAEFATRRADYVDPSKATLGEFLDRWERDWASINVSPKTLERYRELLRVHVRPRGSARCQSRSCSGAPRGCTPSSYARVVLRMATLRDPAFRREPSATFTASYTRHSGWR